ncbi:hypothetical protein HDU76_000441 [Blyttiomyces sp. JEL0837]|nr:hypothetical protein HDU76_000441 [Blyttiomyces sp. JEL0837]
MATVYPYLYKFSQHLNSVFETVDMRWGVLDTSTAEHLTSELCMKQLYKCLNESSGPSFFSILGDKYGYRPFPPVIEYDIFNTICDNIEMISKWDEMQVIEKFGSKLLSSRINPTSSKSLLEMKWKLRYWFKLEMNSVPVVYRLVVSLGPGDWDRAGQVMLKENVAERILYWLKKDVDAERRRDVSIDVLMILLRRCLLPSRVDDWRNDESRLMRLLRAGSWDMDMGVHGEKGYHEKDSVHRMFVRSVTEEEVLNGLTRPDKFIGFQRTFTNIASQTQSHLDSLQSTTNEPQIATIHYSKAKQASSYIDLLWKDNKPFAIDTEATTELLSLKKSMKNPPPMESYHIPWLDGFDPDSKSVHYEYVNQFCDRMCEVLCNEILRHDQNRIRLSLWDKVLYETLKTWQVRDAILSTAIPRGDNIINNIITELSTRNSGIYIVKGGFGIGKTNFMARLSQIATTNLPDNYIIITRFIGTTTDSNDSRSLMSSLTCQILRVLYDGDFDAAVKGLFGILSDVVPSRKEGGWFWDSMLDGIDQLNDRDAFGKSLGWLPSPIPSPFQKPPMVSFIFSTTVTATSPESTTEPETLKYADLDHHNRFLIRLQTLYNRTSTPLFEYNLPNLTDSEINEMISTKLTKGGSTPRKLTDSQYEYVYNKCKTASSPLYIHLAVTEARKWISDYVVRDGDGQDELANDLEGLFMQLMDRIENRHGKLLVGRAMAYLSSSPRFLAGVELEDVLSIDDDVLNVVYQYWTPPVRRIPSALYHEQFRAYIVQRYCSDPDEMLIIHKNLADFWSGKYSTEPKPYIKISHIPSVLPEEIYENRYLREQPFLLSTGNCNIRRIGSEPWHLLYSNQFIKAVELVTNPNYVESVTIGGELMVEELIQFLLEAKQYARFQPSEIKESGIIWKLNEFYSFVVSNVGNLVMGPKMYITAATSLPIGSQVAAVTRQWVDDNDEAIWADWLNRPSLSELPLPLITIREPSASGYNKQLREMCLTPSGEQFFYMLATDSMTLERMIIFWNVKTGQRAAKIVLPLETPKWGVPFTGKSSRTGDKIVIASRHLICLELIVAGYSRWDGDYGNGEVEVFCREEVDLEFDDGKNHHAGRIVWSKDDKYVAILVLHCVSSDVVGIQLRSTSKGFKLVSKFVFDEELGALRTFGACRTHLCFTDQETSTSFYTLDIDEWVESVESGAESVSTLLKPGLKLNKSFDRQDLPSMAQVPTVLIPDEESDRLALFNIVTGERVYTFPESIHIDQLRSTALSPDAKTAALVLKDSEEVQIHRIGAANQFTRSILGYLNSSDEDDVFGLMSGFTRFSPDSAMLITDGESLSSAAGIVGDSTQPPNLVVHVMGVVTVEHLGILVILDMRGTVRAKLDIVVNEPSETDIQQSDLIMDICSHPTKPIVVVATAQGHIHLVDLQNLDNPTTTNPIILKGVTPYVTCCTIINNKPGSNPTALTVATGHIDGSVYIWSILGPNVSIVTFTKVKDAGCIGNLTCSEDGERIVIVPTGTNFSAVWRWRASAGRGSPTNLIALEMNRDQFNFGETFEPIFRINPADASIVAVSCGKKLKMYRLDEETAQYVSQRLPTEGGRAITMEWCPDGSALICLLNNKKIRVYRKAGTDAKYVCIHEYFFRSTSAVKAAAFSVHGGRRVLCFRDEVDEISTFELKGDWEANHVMNEVKGSEYMWSTSQPFRLWSEMNDELWGESKGHLFLSLDSSEHTVPLGEYEVWGFIWEPKVEVEEEDEDGGGVEDDCSPPDENNEGGDEEDNSPDGDNKGDNDDNAPNEDEVEVCDELKESCDEEKSEKDEEMDRKTGTLTIGINCGLRDGTLGFTRHFSAEEVLSLKEDLSKPIKLGRFVALSSSITLVTDGVDDTPWLCKAILLSSVGLSFESIVGAFKRYTSEDETDGLFLVEE